MLSKTIVAVLMLILLLAACQSAAQPVRIPSLAPSVTVLPSPTFMVTASPPVHTPTVLPALELTKGPYLVFGPTPLDIAVLWQDALKRDFLFAWGTDDDLTSGEITPERGDETGLYRVTLNQLEPDRFYQYRINTGTAQASGEFRSPMMVTDSLTFWAYGDTRSGPEIHDQIAGLILQQMRADPTTRTFIVSTGDLMDTADEASLQSNEFSPDAKNIRELQASLPVVNIMGNHDGTAIFKKYFPYPFTDTFDWSFDYGPAHFTVIDQYIDLAEQTLRYGWLENDLATSTKPWKVILLHEPGWSAGPHPNNETVQDLIQPLAERYGVDLVIAGHNHYYARAIVQGVTHVTTGGGGAPLYDPERGWPLVVSAIKAYHFLKVSIVGQELSVEVISSTGEVLDQFTIQNKE